MSNVEQVAEGDRTVCRVCHIRSLSKYARARAWDEPITGCIYLCPEHKDAEGALRAAVDWSKVQVAARGAEPYVFPPSKS